MIRTLPFLLAPAMLVAGPTPKVLSPEATVQKQIETFNAHDLEAFLATFSEELEVHGLPAGASPPSGKARLREIYTERFRNNPDLHASVLDRIVSGAYVIQRERISGRAGGKGVLEAVVIYQVEQGTIRRMWTLGD